MLPINPQVFRTYDIRGVVDKDFDPDWAEALGRACAVFFLARGQDRAVVGYDARHTSPGYAARLAQGLTAGGVDTVCIGQVPTPVQYFAVKHLGMAAGVMVTASHNPPEYNGFKVWCGEGTIYGEEIQKLYRIMAAGVESGWDAPESGPEQGPGLMSEHDVVPSYISELTHGVDLPHPPKLVVDGGNGAGGELCARLLETAGCEIVRLYTEPDGSFPNHHPDPTIPENMRDLSELVRTSGAAAGIGLDGDGDRIGVVDETGRLLYGDELTAIFARGVLAGSPGATIIGDVKCTHRLFADIAAHGGNPVMAPTGHSLIKARMRAERAALAGEMSGHIFFADRYYGFDDALYAALRLAEIMAQRPGEPLSGYLADWPVTFSTPELRIDCPEEAKAPVIAKAREVFGSEYKAETMDGIRVLFPDGWGLVRASNTQPVLVARFEAESEERLAEIRGLIEPRIQEWIAELS